MRNEVAEFKWKRSRSLTFNCHFPALQLVCVSVGLCSSSVCTYDVEGKRNEAVVSAQDTKRLLPLHQRKEVIGHRLTVEKVVDTKKEVPVWIRDRSD